ncbi:helix-turn-helix domain-containing protein [Mitsuokella multacida]|uniref:helix-turn-helix domain-containing protein n=1 Tax=Mitsuokella multacida TaxID=52226 RepID=UPI00266CD3DB|nr:helix-turn-helix domain-containing protein [Mitsuokella multacida]
MEFAKNMKRIRERQNLTRKELSKRSGVSTSSIGYYETGQREPTASALVAIAKALHCSVDALLGIAVNKLDSYKALIEEDGNQVEYAQNGQVIVRTRRFKMVFPSIEVFTEVVETAIDEHLKDVRPLLLRMVLYHLELYALQGKGIGK